MIVILFVHIQEYKTKPHFKAHLFCSLVVIIIIIIAFEMYEMYYKERSGTCIPFAICTIHNYCGDEFSTVYKMYHVLTKLITIVTLPSWEDLD